MNTSSSSVLIRAGSPTKPRSTTCSMLLSGSRLVRVSLRGLDQPAVLAADADRLAAGRLDRGDDLLVDLAGQDHLDHLDGRGVGDPQPVDEGRLDLQPVEHGLDLRPAAMDDDRVDADLLQQHDVAGEVAGHALVAHGVAAILDHHDRARIAAHVGQRLDQRAGDARGCRAGRRRWLMAAAPRSMGSGELGQGGAQQVDALAGCARWSGSGAGMAPTVLASRVSSSSGRAPRARRA